MNAMHAVLFRAAMLAMLAHESAFAQVAGGPRFAKTATIFSTAPTITILPAATGALIRSQGAGNASLDLGRISYFKGTSPPGQSLHQTRDSFVISTRFRLQVDCSGGSSSQVNVTASRSDAATTHVIAIDGIALGTAAQPLVQSMRCGSSGEHRLDVEVPVSAPAGAIASTVAFLATLNK